MAKKIKSIKRESIKISTDSMKRYRKLSEHTMIPISMLIEKAMENSEQLFQEYGNGLRSKMKVLEQTLKEQERL
jgi:hypothetical protein